MEKSLLGMRCLLSQVLYNSLEFFFFFLFFPVPPRVSDFVQRYQALAGN